MKYKYHKGSEADFFGAPEWATMVVTGGEFSQPWFLESFNAGKQRHRRCSESIFVFKLLSHQPSEYEVIAHREPIREEKVSVTITNNSTDDVTINGTPINEIGGTKTINYTPDVDVNLLIDERGSRYGKFKDGADIMQSLKDVMRDVDGWNNLTASQKEALDMIQHKIGRILNGDPTYDDSWKDIAGYATLIVNELNGEVK